jgi:hypothetical protein
LEWGIYEHSGYNIISHKSAVSNSLVDPRLATRTHLLKHLIEQHPQPRISFYHLPKLFQDRMKLALFLRVRVDLFDGLAEKVMVVTFILGKPLAGLSGDTGRRREENGEGVS